MANLQFPENPSLGQVYTHPTGNVSFQWNGVQWVSTKALPVASQEQVDLGVANFVFVTPGTLSEWSVIGKKASPPAQLYAANETTYTFAHNFGEIPELVVVRLRCIDASSPNDLFLVGECIPILNAYVTDGSTNDYGPSVWYDDTNVYVNIDFNGIQVRNRNTGDDYGGAILALSKWNIEVKAWI